MKIRCIVFDFDRTLVNLSDFVDWENARRLIIQTYLKHGAPKNLVRQFSRGDFYLLLTKMNEELLKLLPPYEAEKIRAAVFHVLEDNEAKGTFNSRLMPGCPETLRWLKNKSIKIGIASSNSGVVIEEILRLHNLGPFIDVVVARNTQYRMKPRPDQFLLCMKSIGCRSQNSIAVGDSRWDIMAAKEAKMFTIGILTGFAEKEELLAVGSDKIIKSLYDLPDVFATLDPSLANS